MTNLLLDNKHQVQIKKATTSQYFTFWDEPVFSKSLLSQNELVQTIKKDFLKSELSPIRVYLTQYLINLTYVDDLIDEGDEDELFLFWECSEFAGAFLEKFNDLEFDILKASRECLSEYETLFIDYWKLNYSDKLGDEELSVKPLTEIGDYKNFLYVENDRCINLSEFNIKNETILKIPTKFTFGNSSSVEEKIELGGLQLTLRPGSEKGISQKTELKKKVSDALSILKNLAPDLFTTFKNFTHTVIALDEPGMVSFSLQSLPGYSSINLHERDFIDCIDDLIHENGHHYLNYILNTKDLITETPDKDYFSPWRMVNRPIRGIYHGTFTFYWALELFAQLNHNPKNSDYFSNEQLSKIRLRYIEEYHKIIFCKESLRKAFDLELINSEGWNLINQVIEQVETHQERVEITTQKCSEEERKDIITMIASLKN